MTTHRLENVSDLHVNRDRPDPFVSPQHGCTLSPLGRDRFYRRYWCFQSTGGVFVEDNDNTITSDMLIPVKQNLNNALPQDVKLKPGGMALQNLGETVKNLIKKESQKDIKPPVVQSLTVMDLTDLGETPPNTSGSDKENSPSGKTNGQMTNGHADQVVPMIRQTLNG
jgi:hypothetical protein